MLAFQSTSSAFRSGFPTSAIRFADDREGCQFTVTVYRKGSKSSVKSSVKMGVIPAIPDNAGKNVGENVGNGSSKVHPKQKVVWRCPSIHWHQFFRIGPRLKPVGFWPDIGGSRPPWDRVFYFVVTILILSKTLVSFFQ